MSVANNPRNFFKTYTAFMSKPERPQPSQQPSGPAAQPQRRMSNEEALARVRVMYADLLARLSKG